MQSSYTKILLLGFILLTSLTVTSETVTPPVVSEICNNNIDDDNDGLTDCSDPDCSGQSVCNDAFTCSSDLYQVISGTLKKFDPLSSTYIDIGYSEMGSYNGAGYNVEDGYMYGIKTINGVRNMVRIKSSGEIEVYGAINNFQGATYRADIDEFGNWVSFDGGANPVLYKVDLDQFPLTMEVFSLTNLYSKNIPGCADITYNPVTKKFYGMSSNFDLIELDLNDLTANVAADFPGGGTGGFGAAWSDVEGNSYFSNNGTGEIWQVKFDGSNNPLSMEVVAYGQVTNNNDGMNCILALPPFETDCSDNIDNDGDGLVDGEDPDCTESPGFTSVTNDPTVNNADNSWGICWIDYDNDCYDDMFVPSYDPNVPSRLYHNNGNGTFTEVNNQSIVTDLAGSVAASWADFNNDGFHDVVVANNIGNSNFLYTNNNGSSFSRSDNSLANLEDDYAHSVSFADYDNDGFVDIFISDFFDTKFNKLYRNNGDGTFEQITSGDLVQDAVRAIGSTWADVNGDGLQDLFVPVYESSNILYINNGNRSFTKRLMGDNATSVGSSFGDYDNDGDLDLFVSNAGAEDNFLYQNDGSGNFTLQSNSQVSQGGGNSHGSAWGDFNNDGWLDLYVANDQDGVKLMYMNDGTGELRKVNVNDIIAPQGNSFGVATADYDNDGDLDIAIANHSGESNYLYTNDGNGNNYLNLILKGTNSNASALGAKVFVTAIIDGQSVTQMREVSAQTGGGPGSQNSLTQHFGLGDASIIDEVRIEWPSGYVQTETNVAVNQKKITTEENGSVVSGTAYYDANSNCTQDAGESGIPNTIIEVYPGPTYTMTDENGDYKVYLQPGSYNVGQQTPNNFTNICPGEGNTHSVSVSGIGLSYPNNDFAYQTGSQLPDLCVDLGVTALRRGFENEMSISYSNYGVAPASNVVIELTLDNYISITEASIPWDSQSANKYTWNIGTLGVNESGVISLKNYVDLATNIEDLKTFDVSITASESDMNTSCRTTQSTERVVGAIDPNDILVSPVGYGPAHLINPTDTLTYKIRFQNVGNYPASLVNIVDTLPAELDLSSLQLGAVSHEYTFEMSGNGILKWTFEDINLPDSTTNERESHGFVQFKIVPKQNLPEHTRIENRASIVFDFNLPVVTNTVYNTIDFELSDKAIDETKLFVYPNPATSYVNLFMYHPYVAEDASKNNLESVVQSKIAQLEIVGIDGKRHGIALLEASHQHTINIEALDKGMYLLICTDTEGNQHINKFIKQ